MFFYLGLDCPIGDQGWTFDDMIPTTIQREHVLKAAIWIDEHGVPRERESTKYLVIINDKPYPPKYVISRANFYPNGNELSHEYFTGGAETNAYLRGLGFEIRELISSKARRAVSQESRPKDERKIERQGGRIARTKLGKPPIDRIIIDGSNVACYEMTKGSADASQLASAYDQLLSRYGFNNVRIVVGAALRHKVGQQGFDWLQTKFENEKSKKGARVMYQAPARESDDAFIIRYAIDHDYLILTNDLYRDHALAEPEDATEILRRLVKYMIMDGDLTIARFPDY